MDKVAKRKRVRGDCLEESGAKRLCSDTQGGENEDSAKGRCCPTCGTPGVVDGGASKNISETVAEAVRKREAELREEFTRILNQQLREQHEQFTQYTWDAVHRKIPVSCTYIG